MISLKDGLLTPQQWILDSLSGQLLYVTIHYPPPYRRGKWWRRAFAIPFMVVAMMCFLASEVIADEPGGLVLP